MTTEKHIHRRNKILALLFIAGILLYIVLSGDSFALSKALWSAIKAMF